MLEYIELANFQIWKRLHLELVPGINAIIGPSDRGKSSILRALYWLAHNDPAGSEFLKDDAEYGYVEGGFSGGHVIRRFRSKKENKYIIDGKDFSAVRVSVPEEAKEIMQLTETNFQMQDDPFFLLGLPNAGEVAKKLNQVVGLNLIDTSVSYPDKIIRAMNSKIKFYKSELKDKKEKLKKFDALDKIISLYEKLEKVQEEEKIIGEEIGLIKRSSETLKFLRSVVKQYESIDKIDKKIALCITLKKERENEADSAGEIQILINSIIKNRKIVNHHKKNNKKLINLHEKLNELSEESSSLSVEQDTLKNFIEYLIKKEEVLDRKRKEGKFLEKELNKLKKKLRICPLCGSSFTTNITKE